MRKILTPLLLMLLPILVEAQQNDLLLLENKTRKVTETLGLCVLLAISGLTVVIIVAPFIISIWVGYEAYRQAKEQGEYDPVSKGLRTFFLVLVVGEIISWVMLYLGNKYSGGLLTESLKKVLDIRIE